MAPTMVGFQNYFSRIFHMGMIIHAVTDFESRRSNDLATAPFRPRWMPRFFILHIRGVGDSSHPGLPNSPPFRSGNGLAKLTLQPPFVLSSSQDIHQLTDVVQFF